MQHVQIEHLVSFNRYWWALPESRQSQSDFSATNDICIILSVTVIKVCCLASIDKVGMMEIKQVFAKVVSRRAILGVDANRRRLCRTSSMETTHSYYSSHWKLKVLVLHCATWRLRRSAPIAKPIVRYCGESTCRINIYICRKPPDVLFPPSA